MKLRLLLVCDEHPAVSRALQQNGLLLTAFMKSVISSLPVGDTVYMTIFREIVLCSPLFLTARTGQFLCCDKVSIGCILLSYCHTPVIGFLARVVIDRERSVH